VCHLDVVAFGTIVCSSEVVVPLGSQACPSPRFAPPAQWSSAFLPHRHGNILLPSCLLARCQDWSEALHWYNTALETTDCDEGGEYDGIQDEPQYALLAREAEMLLTGGFGLDKNPQRSGEAHRPSLGQDRAGEGL
jgi:hypothetical protein